MVISHCFFLAFFNLKFVTVTSLHCLSIILFISLDVIKMIYYDAYNVIICY